MRTLPCVINSRRDSLGNYPRVAVDRAGQMLGEMEKAKGGAQADVGRRGAPAMPSQGARPLSGLGISHDQSSRWQKLAAIPEAGIASLRGMVDSR
jgi:hypothetical protein